MSALSATSACASPSVFPISCVISRASASEPDSAIRRIASRTSSARSASSSAAQLGWIDFAAATASSTCARVEHATRAMTSPVAGLTSTISLTPSLLTAILTPWTMMDFHATFSLTPSLLTALLTPWT